MCSQIHKLSSSGLGDSMTFHCRTSASPSRIIRMVLGMIASRLPASISAHSGSLRSWALRASHQFSTGATRTIAKSFRAKGSVTAATYRLASPSVNRILAFGLLLLAAPAIASAQAAHPRIWLDSATMTRLTALKNANDPSWLALKADADAFASKTVDSYSNVTCPTTHICYPYEGFGYFTPIEALALAYKMTGDTTYSNQVKVIMNAMAAAGVAPCTVDSGYPSRTFVLGLALGYDWIYDQLSPTDITNYTAEADTCWNWVQASGYQWNANANAYSNYFGAHMLGYGLLALAIEGDDANSSTMQSAILTKFNNYTVPAFTTGAFTGGYAIESYSYGGPHFVRILQYMKAMQTAGKTDLFTTYNAWFKTIFTHYIHASFPDEYTMTTEGHWAGALSGFLFPTPLYDLQGLATGRTEGGWMLQFYNNVVAATPAAIPAGNYASPHFDLFLYNTGQSPVDYKLTEPTFLYSPVDFHSYLRTDWTTSAVMTTFTGNIGNWADHQNRRAGHILLKRGADPLLVDGGMWMAGAINGVRNGVLGTSSSQDVEDLWAGWQSNTMFYWDGGTHCLGQGGNSERYTGCQQFWGTLPNTVYHNEAAGFAFQEAQLTKIYQDNLFVTSVTDYWRSYVNIADISFVFDRISAPSTSTRNLYWHTPGLTTQAAPVGSATTTLSGALATVTMGSSKLYIQTLLPASPTITQEQGRTGWIKPPAIFDGTQHFIVADPNASSCSTNCLFLTVLAPLSSGASAPSFSLITATGYQGALYNDAASPRVAMFSADGTRQTGVTYTASYSSGLTGTHVVTDLATGTYSVKRDGTTILSGLSVLSDGSLKFSATGGTSFQVLQSGSVPQANAPTFSPVAGSYLVPQTVTISSTSGGAIICYSTNGTIPATNGTTGCTTGTLYTTPVSVSASATVQAIAGGTSFADSSVSTAAYAIVNYSNLQRGFRFSRGVAIH